MKVYSIYRSVDGEVNQWGQGRFSTFVRLAGCNFSTEGGCSYCDTKYAQSIDSGEEMSIEDVIDQVVMLGCPKVTITGGEPLLQQEEFVVFVGKLLQNRFLISVETNGSFQIPEELQRKPVCWIMDYKLPGSGMEHRMNFVNFLSLPQNSFIKFVVCSYADFKRALEVKRHLQQLGCKATFAFSPAYQMVDGATIFDWLQKEKIFDCSLNIQLHKLLWPNLKYGEER